MTTCSRFSTLQVSWIYPNRVWGSSCTIVLDHCIGHQLSVQPCPVKLDLHSVLPSDQLCNLVADLRNLAEYSLMDLLPWRMHCSLTRAFSSSKGSSNCSWKACMNLHMLHSSGVQVRYTVTYHLATAPPPRLNPRKCTRLVSSEKVGSHFHMNSTACTRETPNSSGQGHIQDFSLGGMGNHGGSQGEGTV